MLANGLTVVLLVTSVPLVRADLDYSVCTPAAEPVFPPPPALTTSKLLSLQVEWRETLSKKTYNVIEYYDNERKLGALSIQLPPQEDVKIIFDYAADVAMVIQLPTSQSDSTTCSVTYMGSKMYRYDNKPWLTSLMFLYRAMLGTKDTEFLLNSTMKTIRSYPVQEWRACMYDFYTDITTQLQLFFSDGSSGWITPHLPPSDPMLVSIMLHSKRENTPKEEFRVVGDVVDLTPFPKFPPDAFMTPPGVYCRGRPIGQPLPDIADSFYMLVEMVNRDTITFNELWYDHDAQKIRRDTKSALGNDPNPKSTVYNFVTGVRYEQDLYLGTCNVETIQAGDDYTAVTPNNFISIQNVSEVFYFEGAFIQYAGEMTTRGVLCDVWIGVHFDENSNTNDTVQWYFTKEGSTKPVIYNIHKYTPVSPHWAVFDYGNCYTVNHRIHFVIQLLALDNFTMSAISKPYLYDMMQMELASLIYEEPNRFSNILVEYDGGKTLYVSGMFLDKTPLTNYQLVKTVTQRELDTAYDFLKGNVESRNDILITNIKGDPVRLQTRRIDQISFSADFTTLTTQSTPTTIFRVPTIPINAPTLPPLTPDSPSRTQGTPTPIPHTTPAPRPLTTSRKSTTRKAPLWPWTLKTTPRQATTFPRKSVSACPCPACQCPRVNCPTLRGLQCPTETPKSTVSPPARVYPTQSLQQQLPTLTSGISAGALVGGIIVAILLGAVLCFLVLVLISRHRELPLLQHRHKDTETIPLGNY